MQAWTKGRPLPSVTSGWCAGRQDRMAGPTLRSAAHPRLQMHPRPAGPPGACRCGALPTAAIPILLLIADHLCAGWVYILGCFPSRDISMRRQNKNRYHETEERKNRYAKCMINT